MESGNDSALNSDSKERANTFPHHVAGSAEPPRSRSSISAFWIRFTLWWSLFWQKMVSKTRNSNYEDGKRKKGRNDMVGKQRNDLIPKERNGVSLTGDERQPYEILLDVVEKRRQSGIPKPRVLVITDLAKDYDDLAAMVILKELHCLGVIELLGFIANLQPEEKRARFGRGALDHLDLKDILIATGTSGYPHGTGNHKEETYEFDCPFMADKNDPRLRNDSLHPLTGNDLLTKFCENAAKTGQKLTLLLISSLEDIHTFSISNKLLMQKSISNIVLQGGYRITPEGQLEALTEANNNRYDLEAAKNFHALMQELQINSTVYTRVAAVAATMEPEIFAELAKTGNEVGKHLWNVQKAQDLSFYRNASHEDPAKRFRPDRDREYFLRTRTNWYETHSDTDPRPEGGEISEFTKVVVYDALAAIGVSGEDTLKALNVLNIRPDFTATDSEDVKDLKRRHQVVGYEKKKMVDGKEVPDCDVPGINVEQMVTTLKAFLKGSLISTPPLEIKQSNKSSGAPDTHPG